MPGERSSIGHAAGQVVPIESLLVTLSFTLQARPSPRREVAAVPLVTHSDEAVTALVISWPRSRRRF
jgi:hypothetical protein